MNTGRFVSQAVTEEALKPILNGPYESVAVSQWSDEEKQSKLLWNRVGFLSKSLTMKFEESKRVNWKMIQRKSKDKLTSHKEEDLWKKGKKCTSPSRCVLAWWFLIMCFLVTLVWRPRLKI